MMGKHVLIVLFWVLFGVLHSLMATTAFKQKAQRLMGNYFSWYRPLYSAIAFIETAAILVYQFTIDSIKLWEPSLQAMGFFALSALAGLLIMTISIKKYFFKLSGIDVLYKKKQQPVLETNGLHEFVRHPLYAGTLLFGWSVFFLFPQLSYLLTCITITVYTLIGIKLEEKKLAILFGPQYVVYKLTVPMIIPFTKFGRLSKAVTKKLP